MLKELAKEFDLTLWSTANTEKGKSYKYMDPIGINVIFNEWDDMTRTVVLGRADDEMKKLYNSVLTAQLAALDAAKEGFSCRELDKIARDIIDNNGYKGYFGHSLGHGVGMYVHETPNLSQSPRTSPSTVLCRGNVVTVEPGIYISGKYGCRIEDMIAIDLDGSVRNFTKSPKELIELF